MKAQIQIRNLEWRERHNPFRPGEMKTAVAELLNPATSLFPYKAELYLNKPKMATSGTVFFNIDAGITRKINFPITMPTIEGTYPVFLDIFSDSQLLAAYQADEDVKIGIPIIKAVITRAYVYNKYAKTTIYWNGYAHLGLNNVKVDLTQFASRDTYFGFILINNSNIALPFDFKLWQDQWVPPNTYERNIPLTPTTMAPIPMSNGIYEADKKLLPGGILEPGQKGFIAVPATWGQRWCYIYCSVTYKGKDLGIWYTGGWGGY